jgi:hypothetical protein
MADSITFRGAHIRYYDGRLEEGGAFVRIHMTTDFSQPVMEEMDWEDPGSSVMSAKLEGQLLATHLVLTPGDAKLRKEEVQFDISEVLDFNVASVKEGDSRGRELRFIVRSSAAGVAAIVEQYVRRVGDHQGALKVSYTKQEELPLGSKPSTGDYRQQNIDEALADKNRDTGCTHCDLGLALAEPGKHQNGFPCTAREQGAAPTMEDRKKAKAEEMAKRRSATRGPSTGEAVAGVVQ